AAHAGGHAHIEERHGEWASVGGRLLDSADGLLPLLAQLEFVGLVGVRVLVAEQLGLQIIEAAVRLAKLAIGEKDAAVGVQYARLVVCDQDAVRRRTHAPSSIRASRGDSASSE